MHPRLRAACDLQVPTSRELAGHHHYDGVVQDLSPTGVRDGLRALGDGSPLEDPHDEAHLAAVERGLRIAFGEVEVHRHNPRLLLSNLDLAVYDRPYAPEDERTRARQDHLAGWPDAIDAGLASLDAVAAPTARALLPAVRGLADPLDQDTDAAALHAHGRFVTHLEAAAADGDPDPALGASHLAQLLGGAEATTVDLGDLSREAEAERQRLTRVLADACDELRPGARVADVVGDLRNDHPDTDGVLSTARTLTDEALGFTHASGVLGADLDGEVVVSPSPPSRRWATASMSWAAPFEPDGPSFFFITPPDPGWSTPRQSQWLSSFSHTTLPATAVHEVAPGHFAHGRLLRHTPGDVRRSLFSLAFVEGWAHYAEELLVEEGFRGGDPRYRIGVAVKALLRVVRLLVAIGIHTRTMTLDEAVACFESQAFSQGPAAESEAKRATFDPTYGRYTWGKLAIRDLRDRARRQWGAAFDLPRFHRALLSLGAPPLGLIGAALDG
jgi:hypothetical protein